MRIDEAAVRKLAGLARLELRDEEIPRLVQDLTGILEHLDRLATVERISVGSEPPPVDGARQDEATDGFAGGTIAGLAPAWKEPFVLAPANPALEPRSGA